MVGPIWFGLGPVRPALPQSDCREQILMSRILRQSVEGDQGENGVRAGPETSKLLSGGQLVSLLLAHSWACCVAPPTLCPFSGRVIASNKCSQTIQKRGMGHCGVGHSSRLR